MFDKISVMQLIAQKILDYQKGSDVKITPLLKLLIISLKLKVPDEDCFQISKIFGTIFVSAKTVKMRVF